MVHVIESEYTKMTKWLIIHFRNFQHFPIIAVTLDLFKQREVIRTFFS